MANFLKVDKQDNVLIILEDKKKGDLVNNIKLTGDVKKGHKIALCTINSGNKIIKYGVPIAKASVTINKGDWVHTHNIVTTLSENKTFSYNPEGTALTSLIENRTIKAFKRFGGDIGIRNELYIVPTVGCVNGMAEIMKKEFEATHDISSIDGIHIFTHDYGCSQMGDDHATTRSILQNIAKHPNAGGVLVLGLGCENNHIAQFKESFTGYDKYRTNFLVIQDVDDEIEAGVQALESLFNKMSSDKRVDVPLSSLKIGLECGGSDGFSGITANPLVGVFSDYIVTNGGTTVLTEVPEMFGAEDFVFRRCADEIIYDKALKMIDGFKQYYKDHGQVIYDNPSPGNKAGGISTLEEKSMGCVQKAGTFPVQDVLTYTERLDKKGVVLLSAPGNDLVATTALGAAGCHLVLFTTGRGTPYGGFVPTVKISTNSDLATRKKHWIDFDAGVLVDGVDIDFLAKQFINDVCDICSGKLTKNELNNFRQIAIFKSGVTL